MAIAYRATFLSESSQDFEPPLKKYRGKSLSVFNAPGRAVLVFTSIFIISLYHAVKWLELIYIDI